ncbi:MAG: hypothetical protein Q9162_002169 [Coniocarpon cinnabarinum]
MSLRLQASSLPNAPRISNAGVESRISDDRDALIYLSGVQGSLQDSRRRESKVDDNDSGQPVGGDASPAHADKESTAGQSVRDDDGDRASPLQNEGQGPIAWSSLPKKDQLFILTLARLAEPIVQTSLASYMFFMLKSFDTTLPDSRISSQAGLLAGSFTFAQCLTAVLWGRLADKAWMGRKNVLIIGLIGTFVSSIGFGFSRNLSSAIFFRSLGGALNGNVGVMRTMISELIVEKKYQTKAFLIMPVTFNVGVLVGPLLGGWLQDPIHTFPKVFGPASVLGGKNGVKWMTQFPYALPNLVSALFLLSSILLVVLCLEETHVDRKGGLDYGIALKEGLLRGLRQVILGRRSYEYSKLHDDEETSVELENRVGATSRTTKVSASQRPNLPYGQIFTRNVVCTFIVHGLLAGHLGAFHNMYFLFLSTPRYDREHPSEVGRAPQTLPFHFTGGLGLCPSTIGFALGIIGAIGVCMQFGVYTRVTHSLGIIKTVRVCYSGYRGERGVMLTESLQYRYALLLFPLAYTAIPFLVMLPTKHAPPHAADGPWVWIGISSLLFVVVAGRTFSLPITQILVNNCSPHPSVLSSVHGLGQSVSAGARTLGPVVWSTLYGFGLHQGYVGVGFWSLCLESILAFGASWLVYEGNGHEIRLPGET